MDGERVARVDEIIRDDVAIHDGRVVEIQVITGKQFSRTQGEALVATVFMIKSPLLINMSPSC